MRGLLQFYGIFALLMLTVAEAQSQQCPPNAHVEETTENGNTKIIHCRCDFGYENRNNQCLPTDDLYQLTLQDCKHIAIARDLLRKKIGQLQGWRNDTRRYQREFEALRADAVRGVLSEAMDAVPLDGIAGGITKTEAARAKFKAAFFFLQGVVSNVEGISEPENASQLKKIVEGELAIRKSLLEIAMEQANEQTKVWLKNLDYIYGTGVKLSTYAMEVRSGTISPTSGEFLSKTGEVAGEIWGLYNPGIRMTVAFTKLGIRGGQYITAQNSINDLSDVLAKNWIAERHLNAKIKQLTSFMANEIRIVDSYRALNPSAPACPVR